MAVNFNQSSAWDLKQISLDQVREELPALLIPDEEVVMAFQTVRDQLVFTNKRIIAIDIQGLTGRRKSFSSLPYSKIQFFTIQTPGFLELVPDSELYLVFSNGFTARFEFHDRVDIGEIGRMISEYVLKE